MPLCLLSDPILNTDSYTAAFCLSTDQLSSGQTGSHSRLQTLYFYLQHFATILLPAGTQTKQWVTDRTNLLETWKKCTLLQILTSCSITIYLFSLFPLLAKQFKFNGFIIYNKVLSCEPSNILLKSQEVRQLFEFHKENQMWFQGLTLMEFRLWGGAENLALL